jgi:hypothetical protein
LNSYAPLGAAYYKPSFSADSWGAIKKNAAWASHPGRIVIADVLTAVFREGERSSRNCTPKSAMHSTLT